MRDEEVEKNYEEFWKCIIEKDGVIGKEQLMKELYDFSMVIDNCTKAYDLMTQGNISKPNTKFFEVKYMFDDKYLDKEITQDDVKDMLDIEDLAELKQELREYFGLVEGG